MEASATPSPEAHDGADIELVVADLDAVNQNWEDVIRQVSHIKEKCVFHDDLHDDDCKWSENTSRNITNFVQESLSSFLIIYKNDNGQMEAIVDRHLIRPTNYLNKYPLYYFIKPLTNNCNETDASNSIIFGMENTTTNCALSLQRKIETFIKTNPIGPEIITTSNKNVILFERLYKNCALLSRYLNLELHQDNSWQFYSHHFFEVAAFQWLQHAKETLMYAQTPQDCYQSFSIAIVSCKQMQDMLETLLSNIEKVHTNEFKLSLSQHNSNLQFEFEYLRTQIKDHLENIYSKTPLLGEMKSTWLHIETNSPDKETIIAKMMPIVKHVVEITKKNHFTEWLVDKLYVEVVMQCCVTINSANLCQGYITSTLASLNSSMTFTKKFQTEIRRNLKLFQTKSEFIVTSFIQRCHQLVKLCNYLHLFGRWNDGSKAETPITSPSQLLTEILVDSELVMDELLRDLYAVHSPLLDLSLSSWQRTKHMFECRMKKTLTAFLSGFKDEYQSANKSIKMQQELLDFLTSFNDIEEIHAVYLEITITHHPISNCNIQFPTAL